MGACAAWGGGCPALVPPAERGVQGWAGRGGSESRPCRGAAYEGRTMATTAEIRELLATTSLPGDLVDDLLDQASAAWLLGDPAEALAADLALCHPPLADEEVRAVVRPTSVPATWRVTVVAADRPGLLAGTAGAMAAHGLPITSAAGTVCP